MPASIAELKPFASLRFNTLISQPPSSRDFLAYSSAIFHVPSGELSSTTMISAFVSEGRHDDTISSIFVMFWDSLYVGIMIERDFERMEISVFVNDVSISLLFLFELHTY